MYITELYDDIMKSDMKYKIYAVRNRPLMVINPMYAHEYQNLHNKDQNVVKMVPKYNWIQKWAIKLFKLDQYQGEI